MRRKTAPVYLFLCFFLIIAGCAGLPPIVCPDDSLPDEKSISRRLNTLFPADSVQFVHAIELTMPGNHSAMLMGVVNTYPADRTIRCAVMTLEGLVLFEADHTSDHGISIHRATPPFDSPAFAQGLISDIELIFFRPRGRLNARGKLENKNTVLRFSEPGGETTDIAISPDRTIWTQTVRTGSHRIKRCVKYIFPNTSPTSPEPAFPKSIILTAAFPSRYTLTMTLTDATLISDTQSGGDNK